MSTKVQASILKNQKGESNDVRETCAGEGSSVPFDQRDEVIHVVLCHSKQQIGRRGPKKDAVAAELADRLAAYGSVGACTL